ncbi:unnamed protein product [Symbiodinium natans]|uniref:C2 domain-containing protein n=1 Tax=Symbiodinium natans TaxID=878477 RepID=A0A812VFH6_9DINO|nr:unnamed protein product [Symbiodinium natans]
MKALEKVVGKEIRKSHPLLFQRLDDHQLDSCLLLWLFCRLSVGRWLYGSENLKAEWPPIGSQRSFLLLTGKINLYRDPDGIADYIEIGPGSMFGEQPFRLGDEEINDAVGGAAHCQEPCMVGIVTGDVLEACFADRFFGNRRIAQKIRHSTALARAVLPEPDPSKPRVDPESLTASARAELFETCSSAVKTALDDMSRLVAVLHPKPGDEILTTASLDESVFYVEEGSFALTAMQVTLTERPESRPPKRTRIHVYIDRAEKLAGESIFDKLDPYCIIKLGEYKRFQTPVQWNAGVPALAWQFRAAGWWRSRKSLPSQQLGNFNAAFLLVIPVVGFQIMDYDKFTSDDLCGNCTLLVDDLQPGGRTFSVELRRPKSAVGMMMKEDADLPPGIMTEPAGKVFIAAICLQIVQRHASCFLFAISLQVKWDYETHNPLVLPKQKTWTDQALFNLQKNHIWGHERLMLGSVFTKALEGAAAALQLGGSSPMFESAPTCLLPICRPYRLQLQNFTMRAAEQKGRTL